MDLTLDTDDQDRVIHLSILDTEFLGQAIRQKIEPRHFSSDVRQKVYKTSVEFYNNYGKAPGVDIVSEINSKIKRKKIREDDKDLFENYLLDVISIPEFPKRHIMDNLAFFTKTRIVRTLLNTLLKQQDRFEIDPEKSLIALREAVIEANSVAGRSGAESILYDPVENITQRDFVTRFGIAPIDQQLKGGLRVGNYVIILAYLGMGKSWCINHLAKMAVRFGNSPLVIPTEMANETARLRFRMSFTGLTTEQVFERPAEVRNQVAKSMLKGADIFLLSEEEKSMRVDELPAIIEDTEAKTGKEIKLILFDSADDLLPPDGHYAKPIDANTAIHTFLKNYAKDENKCVVSTVQAQRIGGEKFWLNAANVSDNINKFRKATVGISINGKENEKKRWYYRMWLFKNTDGREGARIWARRDFERGQFVTRYSRYGGGMDNYTEWLEQQPIMDEQDD